MKTFFGLAFLLASLGSQAQYYYRDIIGTQESGALLKAYAANKVRSVSLRSFTLNNTPLDNLSIQQQYNPQQRSLLTITRSEYTHPSYLTTYADAIGRVVRTVDSTNGVVNVTNYTYTQQGQLLSVAFVSGDSLTATKTDDHLWQYDAQNRALKMLRIKNRRDTAVVTLKLDEKGNVIEEQERRRALTDEPYYYYYDEKNRLTDIVRFNKRAGRLLPETMLEYSETDQVIQRITVPQNSDDYLIWRFAYDAKGLKTKEIIFNKGREQTGRVEYSYTFGE